MKLAAVLLILLLLSACVQKPAEPEKTEDESGTFGEPGLEELPQTSEDAGLTGEPLDLGSII